MGGGIHFINATSGINATSPNTRYVLNHLDETGNFDDDKTMASILKADKIDWSVTASGTDQNEKQDIANLTAKELKVANKLSALLLEHRQIAIPMWLLD